MSNSYPNPTLAQSFLNLFSLSGLIAFLAGVLCTYFWYWAKDRWRDRKDPARAPHRTQFRSLLLLWVLVYVVVGYMAIKQETLAQDTRHCEVEFQQHSIDMQRVQHDDSMANRAQLTALADWFKDALFPPPDIAKIRADDPNWQTNPVYLRWALDMTNQHYAVIEQAQEQQRQADEYRQQHPPPKPTCGV